MMDCALPALPFKRAALGRMEMPILPINPSSRSAALKSCAILAALY